MEFWELAQQPTRWHPDDGWTPHWRRWFGQCNGEDQSALKHRDAVDRSIRAVVAQLAHIDRLVIEGYYFEGLSLPRIAQDHSLSADYVASVRRRALGVLRLALAALVEHEFGITVVADSACDICRAVWRESAEAILDEKTDRDTWGDLITRIERATGWRAPSPQTLRTHQSKHRAFVGRGQSLDADTSERKATSGVDGGPFTALAEEDFCANPVTERDSP